jgi:hypothetical protein
LAALRAPAVLDSQPWSWRLIGDVAELRADWERRHRGPDPDGRLLTISCGAALDFANTALAGTGTITEVVRFPDPADVDLIARLRVTGFGTPEPMAVRQHQAMALRGTDRRPLAGVDVPRVALDRLDATAEAHGAHLHMLDPHDLPRWIKAADPHATYALLWTDAESRLSWLAAGEALSAVVLAATMERLVALPLSEPAEASSGPALVLRVGVPDDGRRRSDEGVRSLDPTYLDRRSTP